MAGPSRFAAMSCMAKELPRKQTSGISHRLRRSVDVSQSAEFRSQEELLFVCGAHAVRGLEPNFSYRLLRAVYRLFRVFFRTR